MIWDERLKMPHFGRSARRRLHGAVAVLGLAALASVAGCAPAGAIVSGQVTLDGAPLEDANISFVPKAGGGQLVEMGRLNVRVPLKAVVAGALVVGDHQDDIRSLGLSCLAGAERSRRSEPQSDDELG